jgi:hypothetical protein
VRARCESVSRMGGAASAASCAKKATCVMRVTGASCAPVVV